MGTIGTTSTRYHHIVTIKIRQILMRSDSELQVFTFRSDEWIGLLTQSDIAKSDGIKSDLRMLKSDFGPKSGDSVHRILKPK